MLICVSQSQILVTTVGFFGSLVDILNHKNNLDYNFHSKTQSGKKSRLVHTFGKCLAPHFPLIF